MKKIKWGILGTGKIAHKFAEDLLLSKNSVLFGVASRYKSKAKTFGKKFGAEKYYGSYQELAQDAEIDIVYIATPHPFHYKNTLMCLEHNKHVLCEKPMGMNKNEVSDMIKTARSKKLFLMEAMWTRFIPATDKMLQLISSGVIGKPFFVGADFGFKAEVDWNGRIYNKKLGGGALLDIGIYPIFLALLVLGMPAEIKAVARIAKSGVDTFCAMLFNFSEGEKAVLEATVEADTPIEGYIYGEKGFLKLNSRFHHTRKITLNLYGKKPVVYKINYRGNGYFHEILEVEKCLTAGKTESDKFQLNNSLNLIEVIDRVRKEIGLFYEKT